MVIRIREGKDVGHDIALFQRIRSSSLVVPVTSSPMQLLSLTLTTILEFLSEEQHHGVLAAAGSWVSLHRHIAIDEEGLNARASELYLVDQVTRSGVLELREYCGAVLAEGSVSHDFEVMK
jgi:hypothetical protein